jgi:hypothetical protein
MLRNLQEGGLSLSLAGEAGVPYRRSWASRALEKESIVVRNSIALQKITLWTVFVLTLIVSPLVTTNVSTKSIAE